MNVKIVKAGKAGSGQCTPEELEAVNAFARTELTAEGDCHGTIAYAPMGDRGFGYDPVFFVPQLRKTFAQMTAEEKNAISHRGNALRAFSGILKEYLEKH